MSSASRKALWGWLLAFALVGCTDEGGQTVTISLRTDMVPVLEFASVRLELEVVSATGTGRFRTVTVPAGDFILGQQITRFASVESGSAILRSTMLGRRGEAVLQQVTSLQIDSNVSVTVVMTRDCQGVDCSSASAPACLAGRCADPSCTPESPEFCEPECVADADCADSLQACAEPRCVDGFCFERAFDERCGPNEVCSPDEGCVPSPEPLADMGPSLDAALPSDAAVDAPPADAALPPDAALPDASPPFDAGTTETDASVPGCEPDGTERCDGDDNDCDGVIDEFPSHRTCDLPGTSSAFCADRACTFDACTPGFADCDARPENGCEVDTRASALHCGACARRCTGDQTCEDGVCTDDVPVEVTNYFPPMMFDQGAGTCIRYRSGRAYCISQDTFGELPDAPFPGFLVSAFPGGLDDIQRFITRAGHATCLERSDGSTWCVGECGARTFGCDVIAPQEIEELRDFDHVATSFYSGRGGWGCGIRGGRVLCWGDTARIGRMSDSPDGRDDAVAPIEGGPAGGAIDVVLGIDFTCALYSSGEAWCWGEGGALGNGTSAASPLPVQVQLAGANNFIALAAVNESVCGLRADGRVHCWGSNGGGELGVDGGSRNAPSLEPVRNVADGTLLAGSFENGGAFCAISGADRRAQCWGRNNLGFLGATGEVGTRVDEALTIDGMDEVDAISFQRQPTVIRNGEVWIWAPEPTRVSFFP